MRREPRLGERYSARRFVASVRGRRLLFVAALGPGVLLVVTGAQIWQSPALLAVGLAWIVAAVSARRLSEPRLLSRHAASPPTPPRETTP